MKSIFTLIAVVLMTSPSFAATTKKTSTLKSSKKIETTTQHSAPAAAETNNSYTSNRPINIHWTAGLGLGTAGSSFHFGLLGGGMIPVSTIDIGEILVGGQTGFLFGPGSPTSWIIPILAAGQINFKPTGTITPYAGLAMGIGIFHSSAASVSIAGTTFSAGGGTSTDFALLAKGGLKFGDEGKYFAELPLGTMGNSFAIFPTFGMNF